MTRDSSLRSELHHEALCRPNFIDRVQTSLIMRELIPAATQKRSGSELTLIILFSVVALVVHLLTIGRYGYFRDELYYIACGRHLAFRYVDQPPLSILLLRLSQILLGNSLFTIRLLPALAGAATVAITGLIARELGGHGLGGCA